MKILAIVGSPRKNGNTDTIINSIMNGVVECGAEVEKIYLTDLKFKGCIACEGCAKTMKCVIKDDMQQVYEKMEGADGLILGSPTYFYNVTGLMKSYIDRLYCYNIFDESDRSVWLNPNEVNGMKYAVTVAVCEQETIDNMGFASESMSMTLQAVGWRSVANIKALHLFEKHEGALNPNLLEEGKRAGEKLFKTISLARSIK